MNIKKNQRFNYRPTLRNKNFSWYKNIIVPVKLKPDI